MPPRKPTLGYASRTDAVLALRAQGLGTAEIGRRIGIDGGTVTALEHSASKRRTQIQETQRTVLFSQDVLRALAPHAARRGIHPNSLARRIVETVVDDGLIDSVLDDLEDRSAA
ncbi:MAG: hypothetical protein ISS15_05455 [Alphaproteobacteria bacterium]|nr:hypothetical protein [Alphaproteobacteria bacterium]MBL6939433.1 hypothetical protein [Alphaproteobacteria bacterium]MBL7097086.1 hypothetical protein [Alphaproteobacteria bacterium]